MLLLLMSLLVQSLEERLLSESAGALAKEALERGDASRGAVVFHQQSMQCAVCHAAGQAARPQLGPDLTQLPPDVTGEQLVESVLRPSQSIRRGYETTTVVLQDGRVLTGLMVERTPQQLVLRDVQRPGEVLRIPVEEIDETAQLTTSLMPAGQVNQLASRQQFLDLVRYLMELKSGGAERARQLLPPAELLTVQIPEYESRIDHAGLIRGLDSEAFKRGEAIYQRVCRNCHGTKDQPGSLPTSLRFAEGRFRSGSDPWTMYQTLTRGFGLMAAQTWMVPSQKYDVIHYIREEYLRRDNPSQYIEVSDAWLAGLPPGDTRGPDPSDIQPWNAMDYGVSLAHTMEVPGTVRNIAQKGLAIRLDTGAGGVARGRHWMLYELDTLRMAAAWSSEESGDSERNFLDWRGIQFNGEHGIHPSISGRQTAGVGDGPGWADPQSGGFADEQRVQGRDGRRYGPLPRSWGRLKGQYHHGADVVLWYEVGGVDVLERPGVVLSETAFLRTLNIGPRQQELLLAVAQQPGAELSMQPEISAVRYGQQRPEPGDEPSGKLAFDGQTWVELSDTAGLDFQQDFTISARVRTDSGGTLLAYAEPGPKWTPNGQTLFIRDGRLAFDIGWVGAVVSRRQINDGQWHSVAATWSKKTQELQLWIDGTPDAAGRLAAQRPLPKGVVRLGFTAPNFPQPLSHFNGELRDVRFFQRQLSDELRAPETLAEVREDLAAHWALERVEAGRAVDLSGNGRDGVLREVAAAGSTNSGVPLLAGVLPADSQVNWCVVDERLCLRIPAGEEPLRMTVWLRTAAEGEPEAAGDGSGTVGGEPAPAVVLAGPPTVAEPSADLSLLTQGGPSRWPQVLTTRITPLQSGRGFAADLLTPPESNPWLAQLRLTGLDFHADGRMAVCTWDGDVWTVSGLPDGPELKWRRTATGLFQPLGLKIVDDRVVVACRDQLAVLHDRNGDGETDFIECLNADHQVTEHFHEFAMGLQTDAEGNFYYAKSGRHALEAVVPQHGTLLQVSADGSRTRILATGFRAANGVCLNPDGSFLVTDQEGFWNPKNRINWVTVPADGRPNFYGNMFGWHDVKDTSDAAMEPPLCWITNEFDRSPGELVRVESSRWGPLNGSLLNLSYGTGKVFLVPYEQRGKVVQGGMVQLPIAAFPTGVMRGRFHAADGQLYLCGMFAWAGSATHPGGLYRLRATGEPVHLPVRLEATAGGMRLRFSDPLLAADVSPVAFQVKVWDLKRTANYGSKHYNERSLQVAGAELDSDGRTVQLELPDLQPTWGMEITWRLKTVDGVPIEGRMHNTVHSR
jgi:putative heme-binding domain-containing protein